MMSKELRITGIPWYRQEDFETLKSQFVDGKNLHKTWEDWRNACVTHVAKLERDGLIIERVIIDPIEFMAWCNDNAIAQNSSARGRFAAERALAQYRSRKLN